MSLFGRKPSTLAPPRPMEYAAPPPPPPPPGVSCAIIRGGEPSRISLRIHGGGWPSEVILNTTAARVIARDLNAMAEQVERDEAAAEAKGAA